MATPTLNFTIKNSSGLPSDQVYLCFTGKPVEGTIDGEPIKPETWIQLKTIEGKSIVFTDKTVGCRFYVYYGSDPNFSVAHSILAPDKNSAFDKCFDKIELTFDGSEHGCADLTAIDFWSIPMNLTTTKGKEVVQKLWGIREGHSANQILTSLHALCNPPQSSTTRDSLKNAFTSLPDGISYQIDHPSPGLIANGSAFVRIIGPNPYPPFGNPPSGTFPGFPFIPYDTFESYFQYLVDTFGPGKNPVSPFTQLGNGKIAHLKGLFAGVKKDGVDPTDLEKKQAYDFWAVIDQDCNLTISGKSDLIDKITIQIKKWDLLAPASSYGGNPQFSLNGGHPQSPANDLYAWILGDFFAGLNIGALGSAVLVGNVPVGEMPSQEWFKQLPAQKLLFDKLWPAGVEKRNHWNQWAEVLYPVSDAYGFAYAERFSAPLINLDPNKVDTLELELLPTPTLS